MRKIHQKLGLFFLLIGSIGCAHSQSKNITGKVPCSFESEDMYCRQVIQLEPGPAVSKMLSEKQYRALDSTADFLRGKPNCHIQIGSHIFLSKDAETNLKVSYEVANIAIAHLNNRGLDSKQMSPLAFGSERPVFHPIENPGNQRLEVFYLDCPKLREFRCDQLN